MKLTPILLMGLASTALSFGANVFSVQSGDWNSDIWSNSAGGAVVSGLRPGSADAASLSTGSINVSAGTYNIKTLTVSTAITGSNLVIATGAQMNVSNAVYFTGNKSDLSIFGTLNVTNTFSWGRNDSKATISGALYGGGTMTLGATATTISITGTVSAAGAMYVGGPRSLTTLGTGGVINASTSIELRNTIATYNNFAVAGGTLNAFAFYGSSLTVATELATITVSSGAINNTGTVAQLIGSSATNVGVVVLNQSGGTVSFNQAGGVFNLTGTASGTGAIGQYNLSGGTLVLNGGIAYGSAGKYRADAGAVHTGSASAYTGYMGGALNFTGGRIVTQMLAVDLVNDGGLLTVGLSNTQSATLTSGTFSGFTYTQKSTGGVELDFLSNSAFDKIDYAGNNVVLEDGTSFYITLAEGYTPDQGTTFTSVVVADAITGDASTFNIYVNGVLSDWTAAIVGGTTLNLTASYIPEPASAAALVGLLALAMVARRRR